MAGPTLWSTDPNQNDTIDPAIFLAEGQPPPTLNNACRAIMAGVALYVADQSGSLGASVADGVASLTTAQGFTEDSFARGFTVSFALQSANAGPMKLSIDGTTARPWRRQRNIEFAPGDIPALVIHTVVWFPAAGAFISISPSFAEPGRIDTFARPEAIPAGYVRCDGRALSRTTYAALFAAIGTTYGLGDNSTTFNVPDTNGRALFGADNGANRLTGNGGLGGAVGSTGGAETVTLTAAQMPSHSHAGSTGAAGAQAATTTGAAGAVAAGSTGAGGAHSHTGTTQTAGDHSHSGNTAVAGSHVHAQQYNRQTIYDSGTALFAVTQLYPPGENSTGQTDPAGDHSHSFTTNAVAGHTHGLTTDGVSAHTHSIPATPDHTHSVPAVAAHTHTVSLDNTGGGGAHANMPPGLVVCFAIKA